jgi:hypothetical protein
VLDLRHRVKANLNCSSIGPAFAMSVGSMRFQSDVRRSDAVSRLTTSSASIGKNPKGSAAVRAWRLTGSTGAGAGAGGTFAV